MTSESQTVSPLAGPGPGARGLTPLCHFQGLSSPSSLEFLRCFEEGAVRLYPPVSFVLQFSLFLLKAPAFTDYCNAWFTVSLSTCHDSWRPPQPYQCPWLFSSLTRSPPPPHLRFLLLSHQLPSFIFTCNVISHTSGPQNH